MWKSFYLEIAKVGKWNGLTFTKSMLKKMLKNFQAESVIPVTASHIPDDFKSIEALAKITKMRLNEDETILKAEMQLSGWMLDNWELGKFLKPSIELYNHEQLGWFISTVALLGEQGAGVKGLNTNIEPFRELYPKFMFCDNFNNNENKNISGGNQMDTKTIKEIKDEIRNDLTLEFKEKDKEKDGKISSLESKILEKDEEIKNFSEKIKLDEEKRTAEELKKFNEKVEAEKVVMKKFGYTDEEIKLYSDKYTDKINFSDALVDIKHFNQKDSITKTNFSDKSNEKTEKPAKGVSDIL